MLVVAGMIGCDTAGQIDAFSNGTNGALASWVTSPDGDLLLSDPTAGLDFEVEFIDEDNGNTVEAWAMTVTDGTTTGTIFTQTAFTANTDGNQGFSGSVSLADIATALGTTTASFAEEDEFTFGSILTRGGVQFPVGNASQFLNAVADFDEAIAIETVSVTAKSVDSPYLSATSTDTVFMEFANDFTTVLASNPTLTAISTDGSLNTNGYVFGDMGSKLDEDGEDSVYWVVITPPAGLAGVDTISVVISDASAFATGFVMANDTLENAYFYDNVVPTIAANNSANVAGTGGSVVGYRFNVALSEEIGSVTVVADYADADTDDVEKVVEVEGDVFDYTFDWTAADGAVSITVTIADEAGNAATAINVDLM